MKKTDFDKTTVSIVEEFADAIMGGLAYSWGAVEKLKKRNPDDRDWVIAQLLFLLNDVKQEQP